jgi:hypothetical protein
MSRVRQNLEIDLTFTIGGNLLGKISTLNWSINTDREYVKRLVLFSEEA